MRLKTIMGCILLSTVAVSGAALAEVRGGGGGHSGGGGVGGGGHSAGAMGGGHSAGPMGGGGGHAFGANGGSHSISRSSPSGQAFRANPTYSAGPQSNRSNFAHNRVGHEGHEGHEGRGHHGRHHGGNFFAYGGNYYGNSYYDDFDDYAYDGGSCQYYLNRYRRTGNPIWRQRYEDCVG